MNSKTCLMEYRVLGKSELKISAIGFGCMSIHDDKSKQFVLDEALDHGINFFDTADMYDKGLNERLVGETFKAKRDQVILSSKTGNVWRADGSGWDWKPTRKHILESIEETLSRLQTDYLDLYMLHGGTLEDPMDDLIESFEHLKAVGKIREYGISSIRPNVIREYVRRGGIAAVMLQYSLLDRRPEETVLELLRQHEIGVLSRGSLAQGLLIDKEPKKYLDYSEFQVQQMKDAVKEVSKNGRTPTHTSLDFVLMQPAITSAVVGIRTSEQLSDLLHSCNNPALEISDYEKIASVLPLEKYDLHR